MPFIALNATATAGPDTTPPNAPLLCMTTGGLPPGEPPPGSGVPPPHQHGHPPHAPSRPLPHGNKTNPKQAKKAIRNTPAIDIHGFEIECLKKQLNIAHTKIKEVETELERAKDTNHILGERIKVFEAANERDVFEK